jgi:REP element-mobilizing transposase RayT
MGHLDYREHHRRNLPHWQPGGHTFFITFRLAGTLPRAVLDRHRADRALLEAELAQAPPASRAEAIERLKRRWFKHLEAELDGRTHGPVWLAEPAVAEQVADSLRWRDGRDYELDAYAILANHVHCVFTPLADPDGRWRSLSRIMQSLKGYTAHEANRLLGREGAFWAHESYDHCVRDHDEWRRLINYTLDNPVKAGLTDRWQDWPWSWLRADEVNPSGRP